jgi:uncharacterized membrane protein (UPF0182 family)
VNVVAAIRPSEWEFPLFLHVLGAMVLVGGLVAVASALVGAARTADASAASPLTRLAFRSALLVVLPAWIVMRVGGQWVASREFGDAEEPDWVGAGYTTADLGLPLVLATVVLAGIAARRRDRGAATAAAVTASLLLLAYLVAIWAMTTKPD